MNCEQSPKCKQMNAHIIRSWLNMPWLAKIRFSENETSKRTVKSTDFDYFINMVAKLLESGVKPVYGLYLQKFVAYLAKLDYIHFLF